MNLKKKLEKTSSNLSQFKNKPNNASSKIP